MRSLTHQQELDLFRDTDASYQKENFKLQSYIKAHRGDREVKLAEMAGTIRMLSGRSELHREVVAARQDLEEQQLVVHHLRADIDSYRWVSGHVMFVCCVTVISTCVTGTVTGCECTGVSA